MVAAGTEMIEYIHQRESSSVKKRVITKKWGGLKLMKVVQRHLQPLSGEKHRTNLWYSCSVTPGSGSELSQTCSSCAWVFFLWIQGDGGRLKHLLPDLNLLCDCWEPGCSLRPMVWKGLCFTTVADIYGSHNQSINTETCHRFSLKNS